MTRSIFDLFEFGENARGSISRVLSRQRTALCDHSSRRLVTNTLKQPTRTTGRRIPFGCPKKYSFFGTRCRPYSVLLPVGFTVPPLLPEARCALTAPFRPYRHECAAVCFLWHYPLGHPSRELPGTVPRWSPDFPPACGCPQTGGRPTLWQRRA
jgi:hypothetical protein